MRGATCNHMAMTYTTVAGSNGKKDMSDEDFTGFPMIMQSSFGGKMICGKKIRSAQGGWANNLNEKRFKTCAQGEVSCPDSLCL